jgi:hypothetical protein
MRKIIGLAIATILTAYISTLSLSNQSFAESRPDNTPPKPTFWKTSGILRYT